MKVAVFGLGYAGMVSAGCIAKCGHDVWGVDIDADKVDAVARGTSPVVEPGLDEIVAGAVAAQTLHATTDARIALDGAECALICVGTPSTDHGNVDLSHVAAAAEEIGRALATVARPPRGRLCIVVRSTMPPGTAHDVVAPALARTVPDGDRRHSRDVPGVPPRRLRRRRLLRSAVHDHRRRRRGNGRDGVGVVLDVRRARADRSGPYRGGLEVRVQRVPRDEGRVRERDGARVLGTSTSTRATSWRCSARTIA